MSDLIVTNLDELPPGMTIRASNRSGNTISWPETRKSFDISYRSDDALFPAGSSMEMAFDVTSWSQRFLGTYWRAKPVGNSGSMPGHGIWKSISGMEPTANIGHDANNVLKTETVGTVILAMEFVDDCWGFDLHFEPMSYDGSNNYGTGSITFKYIRTVFDTDTDPFSPGGTSGTGGGTGNFDGTSDNVDIPSLPTLSASDTGFITLFNPSLAELRSLSSYMWTSSLFDISTWRKIFADPMDAILGLSIVPVVVPDGGRKTVTVGNISTEVTMNVAATQYVEVDCGTLNVNEFWGSYLDYDPYTRAEIYLPYCGTHPLSVDDIMGKPVTVKYHVDILSGACTAFVKCGSSVLYEFIGQCSASIPITGNNWTDVINGVMSIAGSIGSMVATGGASAPMAASNIASTAVNTMKPSVEKSGAMSGTGGMLAIQTPYIILTRPRQALPSNQNTFTGYPSFITETLDSISGYTEIESIHLENIPATEQELSEIESLLKGGVIL